MPSVQTTLPDIPRKCETAWMLARPPVHPADMLYPKVTPHNITTDVTLAIMQDDLRYASYHDTSCTPARSRVLFVVVAHPFYCSRTFSFSFFPHRRNSDPRGVTKQALLPPPHYGTRPHFLSRDFSPFFPRRLMSNYGYPRYRVTL